MERMLIKKNKHYVALEKRIAVLMYKCSLSKDEVLDISIRTFHLMLEMIDRELHYKIFKTASLSGMVTLKKDIDHYFVESEIKLEDMVIELETFKSQIEI